MILNLKRMSVDALDEYTQMIGRGVRRFTAEDHQRHPLIHLFRGVSHSTPQECVVLESLANDPLPVMWAFGIAQQQSRSTMGGSSSGSATLAVQRLQIIELPHQGPAIAAAAAAAAAHAVAAVAEEITHRAPREPSVQVAEAATIEPLVVRFEGDRVGTAAAYALGQGLRLIYGAEHISVEDRDFLERFHPLVQDCVRLRHEALQAAHQRGIAWVPLGDVIETIAHQTGLAGKRIRAVMSVTDRVVDDPDVEIQPRGNGGCAYRVRPPSSA